jgi:hypothetical protein
MEMRSGRIPGFDWLEFHRPNARWASLIEGVRSIPSQGKHLMAYGFLRKFVAAGVLSLCIAGISPVARAGLVVTASVGSAPTGVNYVNFDNLPLTPGNTGGVSNGVTVTFSGDAEAVQGSVSGVYAAPYLSGGNGTLFGDPNNGQDATTYLTTGTGSVTLSMPGEENYIGLLWGSVDTFNTLSLYDGATLVGTVTGTDVTSNASGDQGVNGTYYVNINSTESFNTVVATSSSNAFEFDNVAYNGAVPEPSSFILGLVGIMGVVGLNQIRRKRLAPGTKA